ncbi:non-ribosomal peptide synthase [Hypoxylon fragiforme]|uniref:non-ribosomal peptide synthase n=1 Tax=Hypoxylon fragiforme TaxID=63214 RepID=UPI0020C60DF8|nr:non-ribosomal peptide synthase [Hypoxylon fragiforme]KAI2614797.1 non-ribosomal peptide synthase [Hypoxylon fragiforme]
MYVIFERPVHHITSHEKRSPSQKPTMALKDVDNFFMESVHTDEAGLSSHFTTTPPTDVEEEGITTEQLEQIWSWNTPIPPTLEICMHDLVAEQASKDPTRLAVHSWDGDFTYHDVDSKSDQLAAHLVSVGVSIGSIVPLCFEKSRWTSVAVLAVMKAGGAFALMDPSQPEGRLRTIVEQTGASVVVTSKLQESLGLRIAPNATHITLSAEHISSLSDVSPSLLPVVPPSADLYIQFTSGSTGKPKGVVITHANYSSGAVPRADIVGYRAHSRVLDFASYAFDVCIDCMLCTLSVGGCLCIPSDADRVNDLSGAIRSMGVNMAHMTPSVARVLDPDIIPTLEVLGLGGEAISAGDAAAWSRSTKVINAYGPSECTVGCAVNGDVGAESKKPAVSIGRGVGGTLWIVDPSNHNRLMPVGSVGELLVEGPIVGPGYLGDPEKTAVAFINDPKWLVAGSPQHEGRSGRLYKTGDLVRYDLDGTIIFVGRGDQQVKLRGQRIELAEIEYNMLDKLPPGTRVAAEVIRPGGPAGEPTLVAFIAERAGLVAELDPLLGSLSTSVQDALADMNRALGEHLPIYMVPAAYIPLQTMPLLVSAKTDRKRLRELGHALSRKDIAGFAAATVPRREPTTPTEKKLARLWGLVLGAEVEVGAHDNFFNLGGDSLRAMKLVAQARTEDLVLTVAGIFANPVLSDMALVARPGSDEGNVEVPAFSLLGEGWAEDAARKDCADLCEVDPATIEDVYPCTPLQEGLMALSAKVSEAYVAQRVVEVADETAARDLARAFEVAAVDCPILRTRIVQVPGHGLVQVVVKGDFDCQWLSGQSLNDYLVQDRKDPVELGRPLVRYGVVVNEATTGKSHFVLTMHHALYDGWSMPLVVERVNRAYNNLPTHRPADFKHFISYLTTMDRKESETYWRERLDGANGEQFPALPYSGYQQQADSLLEHYIPTSKPTTGITTATIIRGAWALLVSTYTASNDVIIGETLTGRNAPIPGVEQIEGPMIATIPVRVSVDRRATVQEYLQEIHDQSVAGIPHEHFGLQHIRRLSPDAREACELRTGLVLHPSTDDEEVALGDKSQPANGFVPAGDAEAAQEALKFNTYALMLVCSLDPSGFLVMASFDSKTVASPQMQRMLRQLARITEQFAENPGAMTCGEIQVLAEEDVAELRSASLESAKSNAVASLLPEEGCEVSEVWIVDTADAERLLPLGAVGELVLRCSGEAPGLEALPNAPKWAEPSSEQEGQFYRTHKLAKFSSDNNTVALTLVQRTAPAPSSTTPSTQPKRVSATSAKQKSLRQTWSRVLGLEEDEIGLNDSFFQLGGDSIGAMKIVSELRAKGLALTVPEIFQHRTLYEMAKAVKESKKVAVETMEAPPAAFSLLDATDIEAFIAEEVRPQLVVPGTIQDILPARPLQQVAVRGTTQLPRFSARYELFHFDGPVDKEKLFRSCQELVARNEILRTVFVEVAGQCFGVVLEELRVAIDEYEIAGDSSNDLQSFAHKLCDVDVQSKMPHGSAFVKFLYVQSPHNRSCLAFRISHAQYDEVCLPALIRQLAALYDDAPTPDSTPFSSFVYHVVNKAIPHSTPYWRDLLRGSALTVLRPTGRSVAQLKTRTAAAVSRTLDISARQRDITIATLPTAAWALCLARRLNVRDVLFGEVVSGRNIDMPRADAVMGPTWQYVPVRVKFGSSSSSSSSSDNDDDADDSWRAIDLLQHIQHQHVASAQHECMGLSEIVRACTDWAPTGDEWFDTVVHQDVYHVEELSLTSGRGSVSSCRLETVYPHLEPLREWKVQAFVAGDTLTLEIVTFEEWIDTAAELLDELEGIVEMLVRRPEERIFG